MNWDNEVNRNNLVVAMLWPANRESRQSSESGQIVNPVRWQTSRESENHYYSASPGNPIIQVALSLNDCVSVSTALATEGMNYGQRVELKQNMPPLRFSACRIRFGDYRTIKVR